jgi:uncharacterized membrane protein
MEDPMSIVQQAIEVSVPLHTAYEQLASFEDYPRFMTGVREVRKVADDRTHWIMELDGERREFDAQITECLPDERVAWHATTGPALAERITLDPIGDSRTRIIAELEADVQALMPSDEHAQESLGRRLKADLEGFKRHIENHAAPADADIDAEADGFGGPADAGLRAAGEATATPASPAMFANRGRFGPPPDRLA